MEIIFDIETSNHLQKDCNGDKKLLRLGLAGVLPLEGNKALFFTEENLKQLADLLKSSAGIIGFNLTGGFDYTVLENYKIRTKMLRKKTIDLMPSLIKTFGSYKNLDLDNIAEHTLGKTKMKVKARYKLVKSDPDRLKLVLEDELKLIRELYRHIVSERPISFKNKTGFIDEHEVYLSEGVDCPPKEDMVDHYEFPFAGMTLEIKEEFKKVVKCGKCKRKWSITSRSYYGDTMREKVKCPNCGNEVVEVPSSLMGPNPQITEG